MPTVRVSCTGITSDQAAAALQRQLGDGYEVSAEGESRVTASQGKTKKARADLRDDGDGTIFEVHGVAVWIYPLSLLVTKITNERGIAKTVAEAIGNTPDFN
jgi:hypothetical protein